MIEELALRRQFMEAYLARGTTQSMRQVSRAMGIEDEVLRRWLRDESFRNELADCDLGRACMAREVAMRLVTAAIENMGRLAMGHNRVAPRAALLLSQIAGIMPQHGAATVNNYAPGAQVDPRDVAQILREMREVDAMLEEHEKAAKE